MVMSPRHQVALTRLTIGVSDEQHRRAAVVPAPRMAAPSPAAGVERRALRRGPPGSPLAPPPRMNVQPVVNTLRATLSHSAALAGADPAVAAAVNQLVESLVPALRLA